MALLSVQSLNVGLALESSSKAPPAWSAGCYLIVTKWRNANTKSSTDRPVQARGSVSTRKEPYTSWKAENASARGMSLSTVSKRAEGRVFTKLGHSNKLAQAVTKAWRAVEQLEQTSRFPSCEGPEMTSEMT